MRPELFLLSALAFGQTTIMRPAGAPAPQQVASFATPGPNGIDYHGGPVMTQPMRTYNVFYGNWTGRPEPAIIERAQLDLSGSPWFRINEAYYQQDGQHVSSVINPGVSITDNYSRGHNLAGWADISAIVRAAINSGQFPNDVNGLYSVFTSPDVTLPGFMTVFCGRHGGFSLNGVNIKYQFTGASTNNSGCVAQYPGPNGTNAADGIINVMSHEFAEMATDPLVENGTPAWYFNDNGDENADRCGWNFAPTYRAPNGTLANVKINGRDYMIQQNWRNSGGGSCGLVPDGVEAPGPARITLTSAPPPASELCESFDPAKSFTFSATAVDSIDGDVGSLVRWADFGVAIGQGGTIQYSAGCGGGEHRITATVTNSRQYTSSVSFAFTRVLSPVLRILTPTRNQSFVCPATVQFSATAADPSGDVSSRITWNAPGLGVFGAGSTASRAFDCTQLGNPGLWACVTDTFGSSACNVVDFSIVEAAPPPPPPPPPVNMAPSVYITTPGNGSTFSCGTVRITALGVDPEDGNISNLVRWSWFGGSATGPSVSISYGCGGPNLGLKTVTASLTDSGGLSAVPSTVSYTIKKK